MKKHFQGRKMVNGVHHQSPECEYILIVRTNTGTSTCEDYLLITF